MRRSLWIALLVAGWLGTPGHGQDFVPAEALEAAKLSKLWQLRLPLAPDQSITDAWLVDDQIYAATNDGYVYAVHADTGALRWMRQVTRSGYRMRKPAHAGQRVIFVTPTDVMQIDRLLGDHLSQLELDFPASSGAASDGALYFFGGVNGRFYAYGVTDNFQYWKAGARGPVVSTPAVNGDMLFVASDTGSVFACRTYDKRFRWEWTASGSVTADLTVTDDGVYVATLDNSLYLLDPNYGAVRWRARFSGPLYDPPVVSGRLIYQFSPDDGLVALDADQVEVGEPAQRWRFLPGRSLLTHVNELAAVLVRDAVVLLDDATGAVKHEIPAPGMHLALPTPGSGVILLASPDGRLFAAAERGKRFVTRDDVRRALLPPPREAPATQPAAAAPPAPPVAESPVALPPVGGKSKISREFGRTGQPDDE